MQFKINIGDITEDAVQSMVEGVFSSNFVFRSPRKEKKEEVTDVLVLFDDVGLIIEVKARAIGVSKNDKKSKSLNWATKRMKKALGQISGAVRAIKTNKMQYVENETRGRIAFEIDRYPWLYGLVILHHSSEPYDPNQLVPTLCKMKIPVHILSFRDFWNISQFLDTPADMINYLEHRTDVLLPTLNPKVHEEQKAFTYYLRHLENIFALRFKSRGLKCEVEDFKNYAEKLRNLIAGKHPYPGAGLIVDKMIEKIHDVDPNVGTINEKGSIIPQYNKTEYAKIATELAKIPRVRRIAIGQLYLDLAKSAADTNKMYYRPMHSPKRSDCMLLMASPLPQSERKKRAEDLVAYTRLAKEYYQVHKAIGIATEPAGSMGSSFDFVLIESTPIFDKSAQQLGREVFGKNSGPID